MKRGTSHIFEPIISKKKSRRFLKKMRIKEGTLAKLVHLKAVEQIQSTQGREGAATCHPLRNCLDNSNLHLKSNSSLKEGFLPLSFLFTNLLTISKQRQMMLIQDDLMASVDRKYALKAFGVAKSLPGPISRSCLDLNNQYVQFSQYGPPWEMGRSHPFSF